MTQGQSLGQVPRRRCSTSTVSGLATVTEPALEIERAPEGVTFEPLADHPRLHELVGWDEKFAAHNAALWQHGLLVVVPRGVVLDEPLYVRIANSADGGSLFWRLLVVAEAGSRFSLIEEYASAHPAVAGYSNAVVELFVEDGAKLEYVSLQNLSQRDVALRLASRARRARRRARLGRRRLRLEEGQDPDPERPRRPGRDVARDRRVLRRRRPAPRLRHVPGAHRAEHDERLRLQGRAARRGVDGVARDDPRREGRAEDERLPGEPQPAAVEGGARGLDPRPRDPRQRRALHARRDARARSTASSSST